MSVVGLMFPHPYIQMYDHIILNTPFIVTASITDETKLAAKSLIDKSSDY